MDAQDWKTMPLHIFIKKIRKETPNELFSEIWLINKAFLTFVNVFSTVYTKRNVIDH